MINYCGNNTCLNGGVCQSSLLNYSCLCLTGSYSGQFCEVTERTIVTRQIVSKSFAYIAIVAIIGAAMFIVTMDVLKYCFGIDPVDRKRRPKKSEKRKKRKKPVQIIRFKYVHASVPEPSDNMNEGLQNTAV